MKTSAFSTLAAALAAALAVALAGCGGADPAPDAGPGDVCSASSCYEENWSDIELDV